jgi:hypothetical protein
VIFERRHSPESQKATVPSTIVSTFAQDLTSWRFSKPPPRGAAQPWILLPVKIASASGWPCWQYRLLLFATLRLPKSTAPAWRISLGPMRGWERQTSRQCFAEGTGCTFRGYGKTHRPSCYQKTRTLSSCAERVLARSLGCPSLEMRRVESSGSESIRLRMDKAMTPRGLSESFQDPSAITTIYLSNTLLRFSRNVVAPGRNTNKKNAARISHCS